MSHFVLLLALGLVLAGAGSGWSRPAPGAAVPVARGAVARALPSTPAHRLRQIERALTQRFGPVCGAGGVRASSGFAGGVQVRMSVAPAHDARGRARAWTDAEAQKILTRMRDEVRRGFADVRLLPTSGVELEPVTPGKAQRVWTWSMLDTAQLQRMAQSSGIRQAEGPDAGRVGPVLGAPEAAAPEYPPSSGPASAGGAGTATVDGVAVTARALAPPPPPLADGGDLRSGSSETVFRASRGGRSSAGGRGTSRSAGPRLEAGPESVAPPAAGASFGNGVETPPTARPMDAYGRALPGAVELPGDAGPLPPRRPALYVAQPGGYGRGGYSGSSVDPTLPTSIYQYPRDNDALEWLIERDVGDALRSNFKDARVHARIERPQVVRLNLEVAMTGHHQENVEHILHFTRDTTHAVFKQKFNLLRIHHTSRIRVTEADDRFSYDYRFHELTPYGHRDRHDDHPLWSELRMERSFVIDVPRAFMLGRDVSAISAGYLSRSVSPGLYSNVGFSSSNAAWVNVRRGFWERLEASLGYYSYSNELTPTADAFGIFTPSDSGLSAVTFSAKYQLPVEICGFSVAVGVTHSFQPGDQRRFYLPDDFERLYNAYVVGSRRFFESLLVHVSAKHTTITQKPDFADNGLNSLGLGFEYVVAERALLMLEVEGEKYEKESYANFGTIDGGDGVNVNAGAVVGTRLGDVEVSARKLTEDRQREFNMSLGYRW